MRENVNICTWIYCDSKEEESSYPQVGNNSSSSTFQLTYWKCVVVYFATSRINNPNANHILYTNTNNIPNIGEFNTRKFLEEEGVQVIIIPLTYQAPFGYHGSWRNQFYIFDILNNISKDCEDQSQYIILDSDCVWVKPVDQMSKAINKYGLLTMVVDTENDPEYKMNGLSRYDMAEIYREMGLVVKDVPHYYGGECFASTGKEIKRVVQEIDNVWSNSINRFQNKKKKFNEEAHMLSFMYYKLGYGHRTANPFIKRIWTQLFGHNNVDGSESKLVIWHMPIEKNTGIKNIFQLITNANSNLDTQILNKKLGIPKRNNIKYLNDLCYLVKKKLKLW